MELSQRTRCETAEKEARAAAEKERVAHEQVSSTATLSACLMYALLQLSYKLYCNSSTATLSARVSYKKRH